MQFVAKTSTPGYTLLHFSINTYTSNFPTSIISLKTHFDNQFNYVLYFNANLVVMFYVPFE